VYQLLWVKTYCASSSQSVMGGSCSLRLYLHSSVGWAVVSVKQSWPWPSRAVY
jgi:hypothetical protein